MPEANPDGVMAHAKDPLQFVQRGVGVVPDVCLELRRIELAPMAPPGLGCQGVGFGGGQIAIDRALPHSKETGGLYPRAALDSTLSRASRRVSMMVGLPVMFPLVTSQ